MDAKVDASVQNRDKLCWFAWAVLAADVTARWIVLCTGSPPHASGLVRGWALDECTRVTNETRVGDCWTLARVGTSVGYTYIALVCATLCVRRIGPCSTYLSSWQRPLIDVVLLLIILAAIIVPSAWWTNQDEPACAGSPTTGTDPIDCWDVVIVHARLVASAVLCLVVGVGGYKGYLYGCDDETQRADKGLFAILVGWSWVPMLAAGSVLLGERDLLTDGGRLLAAAEVVGAALMGIVFKHGLLEASNDRTDTSCASAKSCVDCGGVFFDGEIGDASPALANHSSTPVLAAVTWAVLMVLAILHAVIVSDHPYPRVPFVDESVLVTCAAATSSTTVSCWQTIRVWGSAAVCFVGVTGLGAVALAFDASVSVTTKEWPRRATARTTFVVVLMITFSAVSFHYSSGNDDAGWTNGKEAIHMLAMVCGVVVFAVMCCCACSVADQLSGYEEANAFSICNRLVLFLVALVVIVMAIGVIVGLGGYALDDDASTLHSSRFVDACTGTGSPPPTQPNASVNATTPPLDPFNCWSAVRPEALGMAVYACVLLVWIYARVWVRMSTDAVPIESGDALLLALACTPALPVFVDTVISLSEWLPIPILVILLGVALGFYVYKEPKVVSRNLIATRAITRAIKLRETVAAAETPVTNAGTPVGAAYFKLQPVYLAPVAGRLRP
jgi:hypothetical protein